MPPRCRVAGGDAAKAHPVSLAEAAPNEGRTRVGLFVAVPMPALNTPAVKAYRTDRALYKPVEPLPAGDWIDRTGGIVAEWPPQGQRGMRLDGTRLPERAHGPASRTASKAPLDNFHKYWLRIRTRSLPEPQFRSLFLPRCGLWQAQLSSTTERGEVEVCTPEVCRNSSWVTGPRRCHQP